MTRISPNPGLRSEASPQGEVVLLDLRAGHWYVLNGTAGLLWRSWRSGHDLETSVRFLSRRFPQVPLGRLRADATTLLDQMTNRRLVTVGTPHTPSGRRGRPLPMAARHRVPSTALAFGILLVAALLLRLPFGRVHGLVRWICHRRCRTALPAQPARAVTDAVDRAAARLPGRAACLEISLAAVLLAALRRQHLSWCLGAVADPYRFHAWVEAEGMAVRDADALPGLMKVLTL